MNAKKCDRCGAFYDMYGNNRQANAVQARNNNTGCICDCDKTYELCPDCLRDFERWLKNENKGH